MSAPSTHSESCPRCGFIFQHFSPICPQCNLFIHAPFLTRKQQIWARIGLYGVKVPALALATLPLAWFGTFLVEAFLAGDKFETGGTQASKLADSNAAFIMIGFVIIQSWAFYHYALNRADTKLLLDSDQGTNLSTSHLIAIELVFLILIEFIAMLALSHS